MAETRPTARTRSIPCALSTATPAESYPRYSRRLKPSINVETTFLFEIAPTMPHIDFFLNATYLIILAF